jgi:hypothetical protein
MRWQFAQTKDKSSSLVFVPELKRERRSCVVAFKKSDPSLAINFGVLEFAHLASESAARLHRALLLTGHKVPVPLPCQVFPS